LVHRRVGQVDAALGHQLPRSPSVAMTFSRRSAALRQLVSTALCAAIASPSSIWRMMISCSSTDVTISSTRLLM
jgi:hypothetical protein